MSDTVTSADLDLERRHRLRMLTATFRIFGRLGFDEGVAGHVTARDPEHPDRFWVNPFGQSFKTMRTSDLICCDHTGAVVVGDRPVNRAAFAIHAAIHAARPDVVAAAHTHSTHGRALSTLDAVLEPLTQDACAFFEDNARFDDYTGVVNDLAEGHKISAALGDRKAIILANHGLLTVGTSVESAAWWFVTMERSAQVQLLAYAAGSPTRIDDEVARATYDQVGTEVAGYFQFQPMLEWATRDYPEAFDD